MSADNMVGRTVAGYHLAKYIGEGGTATVYRAEHPDKGSAAVKLLRPRLAQDPIAVKRFLREAEYGSRVTHPNIVRTYDYGQADGLHYLALEWAQGEPLEEFVNRSGKLAPALVATIVEQLGGALAAAHKAGIIHRDLKPANIMYDPAEQRARLLDFGIARDSERRAGQRAGRRLQLGDDRLLPADAGASICRQESKGVVPATTHAASDSAQPGREGPPVYTSDRGGSHGRARPRLEQALPDGGRICQGVLHRGPFGTQARRLPLVDLRQGQGVTDVDRELLRQLLLERSVRFGDFTLASGRRSSFYIDCRPTTMCAQGLVLIGRMGWQAIRARGWRPKTLGGLTMGADPVAYAVAAASWGSELV